LPAPPWARSSVWTKGLGGAERQATCFSLAALPLPPRWQPKTAKRSQAVAYSVTHQAAATSPAQTDLLTAMRGHGGYEATNEIRDVTLQEDQMHVAPPPKATCWVPSDPLVLGLCWRARVTNMRAMRDNLADAPALFTPLLCHVGCYRRALIHAVAGLEVLAPSGPRVRPASGVGRRVQSRRPVGSRAGAPGSVLTPLSRIPRP
jgi:hypothetical protein